MRLILPILLLTCWTAQAATVTGNLIDLFGENAGGTITFSNTLGAQIIGTSLNVSKPKSVALISGSFTNTLVTGNYLVTAGGHQFRINVPNDSGTYRIEDLSTNLVVYSYTNRALMDIAAGSGVTVLSNGLLRTISATADLSSATNNDTVVSNAVITYARSTIGAGATNNATVVSNALRTDIAANTTLIAGKLAQSGGATNVQMFTTNLFTTNYIRLISPIVVSGSPSDTTYNGTYYLLWSNTIAGPLPQAVWTNSSSTKIIYLNDEGGNVTAFIGYALLTSGTNVVNPAYFSQPLAGFEMFPGEGWDVNTGVGTLGNTFTTNALPIPYQTAKITGAYQIDSYTRGTNTYVDPEGSDLHVATNGVPAATLAGGIAITPANGVIVMKNANYLNQADAIRPQPSVRIYANGSTINGALSITNSNEIYDLVNTVQPNVNITNSTSKVILRNLRVRDTTDYMIVDDVNGLFQSIMAQMDGPWDGYIFNNVRSNALVQIINPTIKLHQDRLTGVTWGMHGIGWKVSSTTGGMLQVIGGIISVLNTTNLTHSGTELRGDACIYIGQKNGTTGNGSASMLLMGPTLVHGTTNTGAGVHAISNAVNIPLGGFYLDVLAGDDESKPFKSATFTILGTNVVIGSTSIGTNEFAKLVGVTGGIQTNIDSRVRTVFTQTADVTVANTTTETKLSGAGVGSLTIPANYLVAGKTYKISMAGIYSSIDLANLTVRLRLGGVAGTLIGSIGVSTVPDGSASYWSGEITFIYRGSSVVMASGTLSIPASSLVLVFTPGTTSITPSSALEITPTAEWQIADAGNSITCQILTITELN